MPTRPPFKREFSYATLDLARGIAEAGFVGDIPEAAAKVAKGVSGLALRSDVGYSDLGLNEDVSAILRVTEKLASSRGNGYAGADIASKTITVVFDQVNSGGEPATDSKDLIKQIQTEVAALERKAPIFRVVVESSKEPVVEPQAAMADG